MAGEGSRFVQEGYTFPKPLIDVDGKPMIQVVVESLNLNENYIFLVRKSHLQKYSGLYSTLHRITNGRCEIVEVENLTQGAACTTLLAKELIDNEEDLLIVNSDQVVKYSVENFKLIKNFTNTDGIIFTFNAVHPKWSYVKINSDGLVVELQEKNPISNIATCGIYWYRHGSEYVKYTEQMISKNLKINNEFYVAPVYNEFLIDNKMLVPFYVDEMHGIGTPEDLNLYLKDKR